MLPMYKYFYYRSVGANMHQLVTTEGHKVLSSLADLDLLKDKYFRLKNEYGEDLESLAYDLQGLRTPSPASLEQGEEYVRTHKDCHKVLEEWDNEWKEGRAKKLFKLKRKKRKLHRKL